ncbi:MAG: phasin family protein [Acidimicrobiales bacterium]
MAKNDLFRRTIDAGTAFVDMSRERAEAVVKEWVDAGDLARGTAKNAVDDLLDRSRRVTDEVANMIRREISAQLAALGVATREDLARLEAKIDAASAASAASAGATGTRPPTATPRRAAKKAAPITKSASRKPATKSASRRPAAAKAASPAPAKRAGGGSRKPAATTRAGKTAGPGTGPGT